MVVIKTVEKLKEFVELNNNKKVFYKGPINEYIEDIINKNEVINKIYISEIDPEITQLYFPEWRKPMPNWFG